MKEIASVIALTVLVVSFSLLSAGRSPAPGEPVGIREPAKAAVVIPTAPHAAQIVPVDDHVREADGDASRTVLDLRTPELSAERAVARLAKEVADLDDEIDLDVSNLDYEVFKLQDEDDFLRLLRDSEIPSALDERR